MILGIDPGIRKLGFAVIDKTNKIHDAGIIVLDEEGTKRWDQYKRIAAIHDFFYDTIKKYTITHISIEKYFFTTFNQSNAEFVYGARGVILMLAYQHNIKVTERTPQQIKKHISGNNKASKQLMQKMIMKLYKLQDLPKYHDAADALALARLGKIK